jgi:putative transposase
MVGPSTKRRAVKAVVEAGVGTTAEACRALGLARSSYPRNHALSTGKRQMREQIVKLSQEPPRYGYRRVTALLRREGHEINAQRVQRVRRQAGQQVSRKQREMRRLGLSPAERQRANHANHVWSWDFVEDQTENGTRFRELTLIDEHTRECLAVHVDWSIRAVDVITVVEAAMARYGVPEHLRSDHGPEFIA